MDMADTLTYAQKYEIDLAVTFADADITTRYAGCGTHHILISGQIELEEARRLHAALADLPGIKE